MGIGKLPSSSISFPKGCCLSLSVKICHILTVYKCAHKEMGRILGRHVILNNPTGLSFLTTTCGQRPLFGIRQTTNFHSSIQSSSSPRSTTIMKRIHNHNNKINNMMIHGKIQNTTHRRTTRHVSSNRSSGSNQSPSPSTTTTTTLTSRSERRALERKQRNKERRQRETELRESSSSFSSSSSSNPFSSLSSFMSLSSNMGSTLERLRNHVGNRGRNVLSSWFHIRVVGSGQPINQEHAKSLFLYRLPMAFLLGYIIVDSDYTPYKILPSLGPSMLPTIQFLGDLWFIQTGPWKQWWWQSKQWLYRQLQEMKLMEPSTTTTTTNMVEGWQRGDVVLWKDPNTGRISCKRIVGLPGDDVNRYGTYAQLYLHDESPFGIRWPKSRREDETSTIKAGPTTASSHHHPITTITTSSTSENWDPAPTDIRVDRKITVPDRHVWLEGDCPPFSLDSRHYGPISMEDLYGRLIVRVWPLRDPLSLDGLPSRSSLWLRSMERPIPFPSAEDYIGKRFNLHRIPYEDKDEKKEEKTQPK